MPQGKKNIDTLTIKELFSSKTDGSIPVLLDIQHDEIVWQDADTEQERGHLRLINSTTAVRYAGHKYLPAYFSYVMPKEDGSTIGNTSITISSIDRRVIEVIRSINSNPMCTIEAFYTKLSDSEFMFSKLNHYDFEMTSVSWDDTTAKWSLVFDPASQINIPIDLGTKTRCPADNTEK